MYKNPKFSKASRNSSSYYRISIEKSGYLERFVVKLEFKQLDEVSQVLFGHCIKGVKELTF